MALSVRLSFFVLPPYLLLVYRIVHALVRLLTVFFGIPRDHVDGADLLWSGLRAGLGLRLPNRSSSNS